jgi:superfamily II DNA or RNA helicase
MRCLVFSEPLFTLVKGSHFFKIQRPPHRVKQLLDAFIQRYTVKPFARPVNPYGRSVPPAPPKVYGGVIRSGVEYRYHINQLPELQRYLQDNYIGEHLYQVETLPLHTPLSVELPLQEGWVLRDYQEPIVDYLTNLGPSTSRSKLVGIQTGKGKAQPLTAKIKVPGGWDTMSNMAVGREIIAKDGTVTRVTGLYPQGEKEIYRITFSDGRATECCAEHLWKVYRKNWGGGEYKVVDTQTLIQLMSRNEQKRYYVDLVDPDQINDIELPMDPYLLGLFLGDGHIGETQLLISTPDDFILDWIRYTLPESLKIVHRGLYNFRVSRKNPRQGPNVYLEIFKTLGLKGKLSHEKFIPEIYLQGSWNQRLALLQGLLDTDGTVQFTGSVSFTSSSQRLAEQVQYLVRSLGGMAALRPRFPWYTHQGEYREGRVAYDVDIRYKVPSLLFKLPRKKLRTNDENQYAANLKLRIETIEHLGLKQAQCISIDHPEKLYVTDDFIVTHNSFVSMAGVSRLGWRTLILVKPKYMEKWVEDLRKTFDISLKEMMTAQGSAQLKGLIALAVSGQLNAKVIVISSTTYRAYIDAYEMNPFQLQEEGWDCVPEAFFPTLQVGTLLMDEVHEDFYGVYKVFQYAHLPLTIALSATLESNNFVQTRMYEMVFPKATRYDGMPIDKYIKTLALGYRFQDPLKIRTTENGSTFYSHHAFERSILRLKPVLERYKKLIDHMVRYGFLHHYKRGNKLAIFASSIAMCTELTHYFKQKYPQFTVKRYVEDDPYENVIEADIRITTIFSGGTGIDIPQLTDVILTINVDSIQSNKQTLGRLRKLPDQDVRFCYLYAENLQKHREYHLRRKKNIAPNVESIKDLFYDQLV